MAHLDIKTLLKKPTPHPLKHFFKNKGINQTEIAFHVGMSPSSICQILNGIRSMPVDLDIKLQNLAELIISKEESS